jgi:hypothetical protein
MRGSNTGYFNGDRKLDGRLCLGKFAPDTDGIGGHLSPDSYDLLAGTGGSDAPLPRLMDIWNPVDFAGQRPVQHAPPIPSVSGANFPRQRVK